MQNLVADQLLTLPLFDRKGWKRVRFGDVVKQMKEQVDPEADGVERYVAGEHMETENVHIRKWGTVGDGYLGPAFIRGFRKGQVLYGSRRTYLKKVAVAEWDGVTANTTFVIEAVEGKLLQELLPWLMLSERFTKHSVQESKGSTNPYINFPDIAKFEFDLPPLDQQRRIAEILWAVDEALRAHQNAHDSLLEVFQAELTKVYSGRIGHGGIASFQMQGLPKGWRKVTVAEIARVIRGSSPRPKGDPRYYGGTIPRVMVADITRDKKHIRPCIDFLTEEGSKLSRPVTMGTLVLVCSGTPQQVGLPGILASDACIHDGIIGLVDIAEDCRTEWLFHLFDLAGKTRT
jgi:type I restriction enzyme S subunit